MSRRMRRGLVVLLTVLLGLPAAAIAVEGTPADRPAISGETVTLVTGDRVVVQASPDDRWSATMMPTDPTETFTTVGSGDDFYVIPDSVAPLIPHRLDRELFNVAELVRRKLDDASAPHLPLIVEYEAGEDPLLPGTRTTRRFESIDGAALSLVKTRAEGLGDAIEDAADDAGSDPLEGVEKIWLDPEVKAAIDRSVGQIGADDAHAAGFDGTGIKVAVLDTGIDEAHPDLQGLVVASNNLTSSPSTGDAFGHGTHVGSIIAGSGAASDGQFRGMAPGATLLNGKVLGDNGSGLASWVIAGMEWAVDQGSDVVNMSLGGGPTDGTDPLSESLNALTETSGALFVVAAGNNGPFTRTIGSPGAASAALTVGAVSRLDSLAFFSSRGPRIGDFAIKPDVTAPGIEIVAARAANTSMGSPVDEDYTSASGTSMATPHVAGAAALLAQRNPSWDAADLKSALVTSGVPRTNNTVYEQGGGRIDAGRAITDVVTARPAPLDLGLYRWPHGSREPTTRPVTFTNPTDAPVTLDLALEMKNENGVAPAAGMVTFSPAQVTVPEQGTAEVTVTLDTNVGETGTYGGYLVGSQAETVALRIPVGFTKELERYDLTVHGIARTGEPASVSNLDRSYVVNIDDADEFFEDRFFIDGTAVFRVPPGTYDLLGSFRNNEGTRLKELFWVPRLEVEVEGDMEVTLDARSANPVDVTVPDHATVARQIKLTQFRQSVDGPSVQLGHVIGFDVGILVAPTQPATTSPFEFTSQFRLLAPDASGQPARSSPYLFDLMFPHPGGVPEDVTETVDLNSLARIDAIFAVHGSPRDYEIETRSSWRPWQFFDFNIGFPVTGARARQDFVSTGDTAWRQSTCLRAFNPDEPFYCLAEATPVRYPLGATDAHVWNSQPAAPHVVESTRTARELEISLTPVADADGHVASFVGGLDQSLRLFEEGSLREESDGPFAWIFVADSRKNYRLEFDTELQPTSWASMSTKTSTVWTFASGPQRSLIPLLDDTSDYEEVPPLLTVDWDIDGLDLGNRAVVPGEPTPIEFAVGHLPGATTALVEDAQLAISYDDGATWSDVPVQSLGTDTFRAEVAHPALEETNGFVALRLAATDAEFNGIQQEILRAFALASPEPTPTPTPTPTETGPETTHLEFTERSSTSGQYSDATHLEARLTDSDGEPLEGAEVTFELSGANGSRTLTSVTDAAGVATADPTLTDPPGPYQLTVRYAGSDDFEASADTATYVIEKEDSDLTLTVEGNGKNRFLSARLFDRDSGQGISGRTIDFYADAQLIGSGTTDDAGVASLQAPPGYRGGQHDFEARFVGDEFYLGSSASEGP